MEAMELVISHSRPWSFVPMQETGDGTYRYQSITARIAQEKDGLATRFHVRWENTARDLADVIVGIRIPIDHPDCQLLLPSVLLNNNPSSDPATFIPRIGGKSGEGVIVEEHRLPIPGAAFQWREGDVFPVLSVVEIPETTYMHAWTLGIDRTKNGYTFYLTSGACLLNGEKDVVYGMQKQGVPCTNGYRVFKGHQIWEKTFVVRHDASFAWGRLHECLVWQAWEVFRPSNAPQRPLSELIARKHACLDSRYQEKPYPGYICFGDKNAFGDLSHRHPYYLYAWTGEALRCAWCDIQRGGTFKERAVRTVDFFVRESRQGSPLPHAYFLTDLQDWMGSSFNTKETISSRMVGCSMVDLLDVMDSLESIPKTWDLFVTEVLDALCKPNATTKHGLFPHRFTSDGSCYTQMDTTAGISCITALVKGWKRYGKQRWLAEAEKKFAAYDNTFYRTMEHPFTHATMDAKCEDKEAGLYATGAALVLYEATGTSLYLERAESAAQWVMAFQYVWEPPLRKGSLLSQLGFRVLGWPNVSPQNHHLDVFYPITDLIRLSEITGNSLYRDSAVLALKAWTYGISTGKGEMGFTVEGEQTEQYCQTNYCGNKALERNAMELVWRGGIHLWNPLWITAEVLFMSLHAAICGITF